jgi:hypothetical protein
MVTPEIEKRVRAILDYSRSDKIPLNHAVNLLTAVIERHTVEDVMSMVPAAIYDKLKVMADNMPRTKEAWTKWIDISIRCGAVYDPGISNELLEQGYLESERQTRRAVEALREYFANHEG